MRAGLGLRSMRFVLVSAAGIIVQIGSLMLLCDVMGLSAMPATVAAVEIAVLHNFFWHLRWTWAAERAGFRRTSTLRLLWRFHVANGAISIATGVGFTRLFMEAVGMHYAVANLLSIGVGGLANFAAAEFLVFRKEDSTMRLRLISRMFLATLVGLILSARPANHGIDTRMEQFLRRNAGFGDRELAEARSGARVVRTLDPGIPQEMVTAGVTRFEVPFDYYFERARTGDLYRTGPTLVELGRFSANPTAADLEGLTLDRGDLEPLRELDPAAAESAPAAKEALARLVREYRNQ